MLLIRADIFKNALATITKLMDKPFPDGPYKEPEFSRFVFTVVWATWKEAHHALQGSWSSILYRCYFYFFNFVFTKIATTAAVITPITIAPITL